MAQNWLVNFIDRDGKTLKVKQVNCYEAHRAPAIAMAALKRIDAHGAEIIARDTYSIKVEDA